jgi:hypothetical protein
MHEASGEVGVRLGMELYHWLDACGKREAARERARAASRKWGISRLRVERDRVLQNPHGVRRVR